MVLVVLLRLARVSSQRHKWVSLMKRKMKRDCVLGVFAIPAELRLFFIMRRSRVESGTKQPGNSRADFVQIAAAFYHPSAWLIQFLENLKKSSDFQRWDTHTHTNHYFRLILEMGLDYFCFSSFDPAGQMDLFLSFTGTHSIRYSVRTHKETQEQRISWKNV